MKIETGKKTLIALLILTFIGQIIAQKISQTKPLDFRNNDNGMSKRSSFTLVDAPQIQDYNQKVLENSIYVDFGSDDGVNGNRTPLVEDRNGNYWNSMTESSSNKPEIALVNSANEETDYDLKMTEYMIKYSKGGLLNPDPAKLGTLAIETATEDYFYTTGSGGFKISGLNVNNVYEFLMFGSRNTSTKRVSKYEFTGSMVVNLIHQTSGLDIGSGYNGNNSTIGRSELLYPDANGDIFVNIICSVYRRYNTCRYHSKRFNMVCR